MSSAGADGHMPGAAEVVGRPDVAILYRDETLVVVSKPSGVPVHASREHRDAGTPLLQRVRNAVGRHVFPVHRIDRATSGLVLMALSSDGAREAQAALGADGAHKEYIALVRGAMAEPYVDITRPLTHIGSGKVQEAHTEVERVAVVALGGTFGAATLVRCRIHTGRRHQIRRHLSHLRHQVLVDSTYGKGRVNRYCRSELGIRRLCLHAFRLTIRHPQTGEPLAVVAPLPDDLATPLAALLPRSQWPDGL